MCGSKNMVVSCLLRIPKSNACNSPEHLLTAVSLLQPRGGADYVVAATQVAYRGQHIDGIVWTALI